MACSSCGGNRTLRHTVTQNVIQNSSANSPILLKDSDFVLRYYIGNEAKIISGFLNYGKRLPNEQFLVHKNDMNLENLSETLSEVSNEI